VDFSGKAQHSLAALLQIIVTLSFAYRMLNQMTYHNRLELIIAAVAGAVVGIVAGKFLEHEWLGILIWALSGAVVVSGVVYFHRSLRR
jgi:uncharacterized protein YqgC (DUF456 family)